MKKICFAFVLMAGMASLGEISAAEPVFAAWTVDTDNSSIHNGEIEISTRDKSIQVKVPVADALDKTREIIKTLQDRIDATVPESI